MTTTTTTPGTFATVDEHPEWTLAELQALSPAQLAQIRIYMPDWNVAAASGDKEITGDVLQEWIQSFVAGGGVFWAGDPAARDTHINTNGLDENQAIVVDGIGQYIAIVDIPAGSDFANLVEGTDYEVQRVIADVDAGNGTAAAALGTAYPPGADRLGQVAIVTNTSDDAESGVWRVVDTGGGVYLWEKTEFAFGGGGGGTTVQHNLDATADPTVADDVGAGYSVGSLWYNDTDNTAFAAADVTAGAAVWQPLGGGTGGTPTNLAYTASATGGTVTSSTGNNAALPLADATNAGLFTAAEKTKLAGIATAATVGATTAQATAITANTAKVTNATHTGEVTGATALTITNDAVTNAKLANMAANTVKLTNAAGDPTDGKVQCNRHVEFGMTSVAGNTLDLATPNQLAQNLSISANDTILAANITAGQSGWFNVINTTAGDLTIAWDGVFISADDTETLPTTLTASKRQRWAYSVEGTSVVLTYRGEGAA